MNHEKFVPQSRMEEKRRQKRALQLITDERKDAVYYKLTGGAIRPKPEPEGEIKIVDFVNRREIKKGYGRD